ncbi:uncharacterized protein LOC141905247 [Tubulanus polymorphus]|uniref:uncharacterized protein LOC141905247 n=1 Tax=Tubulanus polymorphus TaxID=672921 RepID=UPI003DA559E2
MKLGRYHLNNYDLQVKKARGPYRRSYSVDDIRKAIKLIRTGTSIRASAQAYAIPEATLRDRLAEAPKVIEKWSGPQPILGKEVDSKLRNWIESMAKIGYGRTIEELLDTVQRCLNAHNKKTIFKDNKPGKDWYYLSMKRHPHLVVKSSENLSVPRSLEVIGCTYFGCSDNAWIDTPLFYGWLANHFVANIPKRRPVLLLLDGHSSHFDFEISKFCSSEGI